MTPPHPTPAVVIILGHAVVRGSEAARWLRSAELCRHDADVGVKYGDLVNAFDDARRAGRHIAVATSAPGYLHPAPKENA